GGEAGSDSVSTVSINSASLSIFDRICCVDRRPRRSTRFFARQPLCLSMCVDVPIIALTQRALERVLENLIADLATPSGVVAGTFRVAGPVDEPFGEERT